MNLMITDELKNRRWTNELLITDELSNNSTNGLTDNWEPMIELSNKTDEIMN